MLPPVSSKAFVFLMFPFSFPLVQNPDSSVGINDVSLCWTTLGKDPIKCHVGFFHKFFTGEHN